MTPHEEQLILKLHSEWGNRWSRIARRLPGRTDNEIKNYWRTHMRKQAQESKRTTTPSSPSTSNSSSSSSNNQVANSEATEKTTKRFQSMGGSDTSLQGKKYQNQKNESERKEEFYSMDDIWQEITSEEEPIRPVNDGYYTEGSNFSCPPMASPSLEFCPDMLWKLDEEQSKMFPSAHDQFLPYYEHENMSWP